MAMTAAQHFEKAEELLARADQSSGNLDLSQALGIRAQAHLDAARLLFDVQKDSVDPGSSPGTAAWRAGLDEVADKRSAR